jgi:hypothetical protein
MNKQDVDSILLANWYFIKCKMDSPSDSKTELARKYLVAKIGKALIDRSKVRSNAIKAFVFIPFFSIFIK